MNPHTTISKRASLQKRALYTLVTIVTFLYLALAAGAQSEREKTTRTGWRWYTGVTPTRVTSLVNQNKARLISMRVDNPSPLTLTVAMVKNTGTYQKAWWWYYGVTGSQLTTLMQQKNARLLDLEPYIINGQLRFAAILVPNDGTIWWWWYGVSPATLAQKLQQNNARLISLRSYIQNGQRLYAAVMISNTGSNARAWWYYYNIPFSQVQSLVKASPSKRLIAMQRNDAGNYNVIFLANKGTGWWYYVGVTPAFLTNTALNNKARVIDAQAVYLNQQWYVMGVLLQN